MFTMTGIYDGKTYSVSYKDGKMSADDDILSLAEVESKKAHGYLGICPSGDTADYLNNELAACDLLDRFVFEKVISLKNDWYDDVPKGAIF